MFSDGSTLTIAYLYHSDDLTGGIFDRHAEHGGVFETSVFVDRLIETGVVVGIGNVDSLKTLTVSDRFGWTHAGRAYMWAYLSGGGYVTRDADVDGESALEWAKKWRHC